MFAVFGVAFILKGFFDGLDVGIEIGDGLFQVGAILFEALYFDLESGLLLIGDKGLAHAIGDRAFVECLVRLNDHSKLITHSNQQRPSVRALDGDLSQEFIYG